MTDAVREALAPFREAGRIPCACAVEIARAYDVPPAAVGRAADNEGIRVTLCQLGLFGYEAYGDKRWVRRLASTPKPLESGIRAACVGDRLACAAAWQLADARGLPRLVLGSVAETLDLRISNCQLGCFE